MRVVPLIVATSILITGCGANRLAHAGPESTPPTATATPTEQPPGPDTPFLDNPQIVDTHPLRFDSWSRLDDGQTVRLYFTIGTPDCFGVHATVGETPEAVTIELRTGSLPEAAGRACIAIAVFGALDVPLPNPLGDRKVLSAY